MRTVCWAQWYLSNKYEGELAVPGWFPLGTGIHLGIEQAVLRDLDLDQASHVAMSYVMDEIGKHEEMFFAPSRPLESYGGLIEAMMENWFDEVHPDSPTRMAEYEACEWPPRVEYMMTAVGEHKYPLVTEADAIFEDKTTGEHHIVDWKTGNSPKAGALQLHTYSYGLALSTDWYVRPANGRSGWFHHLAHNRLQKVRAYVGDDTIIAGILAVERTKEFGAFQTNPGWLCNYCPAFAVCPEQTEDLTVMDDEIDWMAVPL